MIILPDTAVMRGIGGRGADAWEGMAIFGGLSSTARAGEDISAYRYYLDRAFAPRMFEELRRGGLALVVLMLNPSTADAMKNDPTIARMCVLARELGFLRLVILNLYAHRSPHPATLRQAADPIGPHNDLAIRLVLEELKAAGDPYVLCAWGSHPFARDRARTVVQMALDIVGPDALHAMTLTADGSPGHPLDRRGGLTKDDRRPRIWAGAADYAKGRGP